jgi:hypothetical protein
MGFYSKIPYTALNNHIPQQRDRLASPDGPGQYFKEKGTPKQQYLQKRQPRKLCLMVRVITLSQIIPAKP